MQTLTRLSDKTGTSNNCATHVCYQNMFLEVQSHFFPELQMFFLFFSNEEVLFSHCATMFLQNNLRQPKPSTSLAMAASQVTHRGCWFGIALMVALLVTSAHVPPMWWQGGWRRRVGSGEEVELLSPLAAMLMPNTPVGEVFRSFPDGEEDLEPTLTAYDVMKDPKAALFVHYEGMHEKRETAGGMNQEFDRALLAYGPPGSHILHMTHTESRPVEDMVLCIQVCAWHPGDEASLSLVLNDICRRISHGLKDVLCPEVLELLRSQRVFPCTSDMKDFRKLGIALRGAKVNGVVLENCFFARGFSPAGTSRMLKSAELSRRCVEAKLESRIQWLLDLNQSQRKIKQLIATSSPALDDTVQQNLKPTVQRLWDLRLQQIGKALTTCSSTFSSSPLQNLETTVLWLLDLGLSCRQVVKVVGSCPEVVDNIEWFFKLGMTKKQIRKAACAFPMIFGCSIQDDLMPKLAFFLALGLTKNQVAKLIATLPHILSYSIEKDLKPIVGWFLTLGLTKNQLVKVIAGFPRIFTYRIEESFKPKMGWLLQLGMTRCQVVKVFAAFPQVLGCSVEENLKLTVEWFMQLGMTQDQVAKVIAAFPQVLGYSVEENLKPKVEWFMQLGMTQDQVVKVITVFPQVLGCSVEQNLKPTVEWCLQLGMTPDQVAKLIAGFPRVFSYSFEQNLKPKVQWLLQLGMMQDQIAKVFAACPQVLGCSVEENLKPKVEWFMQLGMTQDQVVKVIAVFPQVLSCSPEQNLKQKVEWFMQLGMTEDQVAKLIADFPQILSLSIARNLVPKRAMLQEVLGARGVVDVVLRRPQIMGMSYL